MARAAKEQAAALAKARERRIALDRERDARDRRIEEAAAEVLVLLDRRREVEEALAEANAQLGDALRRVLAEDVPAERAAALCDLDPLEVRRLSRPPARERSGGGPEEAGAARPTEADGAGSRAV